MWRRVRITRDASIVAVALSLGTWESLHDARPAVLTFCAALLAGPLVMRVDERKRAGKVAPDEDA